MDDSKPAGTTLPPSRFSTVLVGLLVTLTLAAHIAWEFSGAGHTHTEILLSSAVLVAIWAAAVAALWVGQRRHDRTLRNLRDSEQKFRVALKNSPVVVSTQDTELRYTWIYSPYSRVEVREARGKTDYDLLPREEAQRLTEIKQRVLATGSGHREEVSLTVNGVVQYQDLTVEPLFDERGRIIGVSSAATDISEHRRAVQALKESEERFRSLFEAAYEGLAIMQDGRIIAVNEAAARMFGYTSSEVIGRNAEEVAAPDSREMVRTYVATGYQKPYEATFQRKDGSLFEVEVLGRMMYLQGRVVRISALRDISERKQAEQHRLELEQKFQQAQKLESLGVLAGGIAHDFNNLLASILGCADLALNELRHSDDPARDYIERIVTASQRAAELTVQMLAYSGRGKLVVQPMDLSQVVREMSNLLETVISKKAHLVWKLAPLLPAIEADGTQMRQVVMNLITNASEALGNGGGDIILETGVTSADHVQKSSTLPVESLHNGPYIYFRVRDTGSGMDSETRDRIFEPFFTTKFTGRGLGLSAVLGIVQSHRGAVQVESEPGQGTIFTLYFPATEKPVKPPTTEAPLQANFQGNGLVLVVDDDEFVRNVALAFLKHLGYNTLVARDGREAVEVYRRYASEIHLVLLDYAMPHLSGEEVYREMKKIKPDVKVVLSSGYTEQDVARQMMGEGMVGFIQKPYRLHDLGQKLRETLQPEMIPTP